jgi:hypothetical protein
MINVMPAGADVKCKGPSYINGKEYNVRATWTRNAYRVEEERKEEEICMEP